MCVSAVYQFGSTRQIYTQTKTCFLFKTNHKIFVSLPFLRNNNLFRLRFPSLFTLSGGHESSDEHNVTNGEFGVVLCPVLLEQLQQPENQ